MRHALRSLAALGLLALAACAAHEKTADKAAAIGDWKTAYVEYRQALADDEKNPQLKARYEEARQKALAQSSAQARACANQRNWGCALDEAQFALSIEPANLDLGNLRSEAAHYVALDKVKAAEGELARGNLQGAHALLLDARKLASDGAVDAAADAVERRWVGAATAEAERQRVARRYPEAISLLTGAVAYDPSLRPQLDRLNREYEGFKAAEFLRLSQEGDQLMARGAWTEAQGRYRAALAMKPDERVKAAERYCTLVVQGDQAAARGDYPAATTAYRDAAALRVDRSGYADAQLARVAVRPWSVTVRGVLVDPVRPDGLPWVGQPNRYVAQAARDLAAGAGRGVDARLLRIVADVPGSNRPRLTVEAVLPDGRRFGSAVREGPYFNLDASFVVMANGFDKRRLTLRVMHLPQGGAPEKVGEVTVTVGELIGRPTGSVSTPPILAMELQVAQADGALEGAGRGFSPIGDASRPAPAPPPGQRPPPPPPKK
jgi:tetratricopeptide (TPR) repeat protein